MQTIAIAVRSSRAKQKDFEDFVKPLDSKENVMDENMSAEEMNRELFG